MAFKYSEEEYNKDKKKKKKKKEDTLQDVEAGFRKAKEARDKKKAKDGKAWENL